MTIENTDPSGFVLVSDVIPDAVLDIRYYSTFNFLGERVDGYEEPVALLTREAAEALRGVSDEAISMGYRLKIFDCYRPQCAVDHFVRWADAHRELAMKNYFYPEVDKETLFERGFVAKKSGHSRGSTVDLTLFDMATQKDLNVGGTFDYFGQLSWSEFTDSITKEQAQNRAMLRDLMVRHGFRPLAEEWWHFTLEDEPYPDTYFTFPVSASQVSKVPDFSEKLENDMEFRLRFFDTSNKIAGNVEAIIGKAVEEAFDIAVNDFDAFTRKEKVAVSRLHTEESVKKLKTAIAESVKDIIEKAGTVSGDAVE